MGIKSKDIKSILTNNNYDTYFVDNNYIMKLIIIIIVKDYANNVYTINIYELELPPGGLQRFFIVSY